MVSVSSLCPIDRWPANSKDTVDIFIGLAITASYVTYISLGSGKVIYWESFGQADKITSTFYFRNRDQTKDN
jgi:hypothetical protein